MSSIEYSNEPIALIGMSYIFAGGIDTDQSFWNVMEKGVDVGSEIPRTRFEIDGLVPILQSGQKLIRRGYFLPDAQLDHFDPQFFGISEREAASMDPCHRILLEKFLHLIEDANYPIERVRGSQTAVFIGQFSNEHQITAHRTTIDQQNTLLGPNLSPYNASARLAYHYDLRGPNLTLDTACSSSLQATHLAVQALRTGQATLAVAGGCNLNYTPETFLAASSLGAISPDGRSRAYSDDANGYAKGEGIGLVLLKRLSDAVRDGDRISCVIRDVIVAHDGHQGKIGYNVPSAEGQARLLREGYQRNEIEPREVFYVEGHGTGTQVGDPIEANALGAFFNRSTFDPPLLLGSVKTVIGHTEGTAGVAALIKVALCFQHRQIPPNLHFTRLNRKIRARKYNLNIVQRVTPFPKARPVIIGINSFGIAGNTAHAIVSEYSAEDLPRIDQLLPSPQFYLLMFSGKTSRERIEEYEMIFQKLKVDRKSQKVKMVMNWSETYFTGRRSVS